MIGYYVSEILIKSKNIYKHTTFVNVSLIIRNFRTVQIGVDSSTLQSNLHFFHSYSYIFVIHSAIIANFNQQRSQFLQCIVILIPHPRLNANSILSLKLKVLWSIINNDHFIKVSPNFRKILHEEILKPHSMRPVQNV